MDKSKECSKPLASSGISKVIVGVVVAVIAIGLVSAVFFFGAPPNPQETTQTPKVPTSAEAPEGKVQAPPTAEAPAAERKPEAPKPAPEQPPPAPVPEQPKPAPAPAPVPQQVDPVKEAALKSAVEVYLKAFEAKDIPKLMTYYVQTGTYAEWKGQAGAFAGKYDGFGNVRILFASVAGNTDNIKVQMSDYKADIVGDTATVTFKEHNEGHGKLVGDFTMEIDVTQKWVYQGGKWSLQRDDWNFTLFKTELVAEGTVFPIHWRKLGDFSFWNDRVRQLFP
ncbi:MAG: nuclear transport factor 2 family protein [Thaumarchaeota archaeon]|nr:nuclear transport factor 2 family protein [Nitrososphaerota archaeon]